MSIPVSDIDWSVLSSFTAGRDRPTLILLHGFTGSKRDFEPLLSRLGNQVNWMACDLPGHGDSAALLDPGAYDLVTLLNGITSIRQRTPDPARVVLLGYSMGARIALHYLNRFREMKGILISGSPGLSDPLERESRRKTDARWMAKLRQPDYTIEDFCKEWEQQPVISSQLDLPNPLRKEIARRRRKNCKQGLIRALEFLGTGMLPSLWEQIGEHSGHLLLHGERDSKFRSIAEKMQGYNPKFLLKAIDGAGHAPHLENPEQTAAAIIDYLPR